MLDSRSAITDVDRNPILAKLLELTFYDQFCAGETQSEVQRNTDAARETLGYHGIIFEYALEMLEKPNQAQAVGPDSAETMKEIETWRNGVLQTLQMAKPGDFVGMK